MATVILVDKKRAFASRDDADVINRWKSAIKNACVSCSVLEDGKDECGKDRYSIEIPHGIGVRATRLLIPQASKNKRQEGIQLIDEAKAWVYGRDWL